MYYLARDYLARLATHHGRDMQPLIDILTHAMVCLGADHGMSKAQCCKALAAVERTMITAGHLASVESGFQELA